MFTRTKNLLKIYRSNDMARKIINLEIRQVLGYFLLWVIVYTIYLVLV